MGAVLLLTVSCIVVVALAHEVLYPRPRRGTRFPVDAWEDR